MLGLEPLVQPRRDSNTSTDFLCLTLFPLPFPWLSENVPFVQLRPAHSQKHMTDKSLDSVLVLRTLRVRLLPVLMSSQTSVLMTQSSISISPDKRAQHGEAEQREDNDMGDYKIFYLITARLRYSNILVTGFSDG